ncbi:MAG: eukaryotic-like serine/threonine-protein kinase [Gaiellales bacterium]|nr:eukaryotic-like serine/threonine-protein kinase [Gaiellales bacterium]
MSLTGSIADRYRVVEPIGSGGMALVYRARDDVLERDVAIKLLADNLACDDDFRRRFVREGRIGGGLTHPYIIAVYDVGDNDGRPFIVMEDATGGSLYDRLQREGPLPAGEAAEYGRQCAEALAFAHAQGVIHRDVKPHNLLLSRTGCVKVADFGIARPLGDSRMTETGSVLGTARYLAPEQAAGEPGSPASDVYSLGVCLWEMLTGQPPFERPLPAAVPASLAPLLHACLSTDPGARPSAGDVAAALGEPPQAHGSTRVVIRPTAMRRFTTHRRPRTAAAMAVLVVLAFGVVVAAAGGGGGGGSDGAPAKTRARGVPTAPTAQQHAHNLALWIDQNAK